jgi:hypothetical protein
MVGAPAFTEFSLEVVAAFEGDVESGDRTGVGHAGKM